MATAVSIRFPGTAAQARETAAALVRILTGTEQRNANLARGVYYAIGFAALQDIQNDFLTMARGGVGDAGNIWPPLDPATIAYHRRFGTGEQAALMRAAGLGRKHRYAPGDKKGLLSKAQLQRWREIYSRKLWRFQASMNEQDAKARAAATAWIILKSEGARTMLQVYGERNVEMLRDTGILFNSLTPGYIDTQAGVYDKPAIEGGAEQVADIIRGGIIVGTNVPYAATHNFGDPERNIPQRQFIPARVPPAWLDRWARVSGDALVVAAELLYTSGGA